MIYRIGRRLREYAMTPEKAKQIGRRICDKIDNALRMAGHVVDGAHKDVGTCEIARAVLDAYEAGRLAGTAPKLRGGA